jgi:hypothetical protein
MDEGGDGLDAVHDRQERGQYQGRENAGVNRKTARRFVREVVVADLEKGGFLEFHRFPAIADQLASLVELFRLRKVPALPRSAPVGFMPLLEVEYLSSGFHILLPLSFEMHFIWRLDSELFPEAPPPIAMPVPTDFYFYKLLLLNYLCLARILRQRRFCLGVGIGPSRLRDAVAGAATSWKLGDGEASPQRRPFD